MIAGARVELRMFKLLEDKDVNIFEPKQADLKAKLSRFQRKARLIKRARPPIPSFDSLSSITEEDSDSTSTPLRLKPTFLVDKYIIGFEAKGSRTIKLYLQGEALPYKIKPIDSFSTNYETHVDAPLIKALKGVSPSCPKRVVQVVKTKEVELLNRRCPAYPLKSSDGEYDCMMVDTTTLGIKLEGMQCPAYIWGNNFLQEEDRPDGKYCSVGLFRTKTTEEKVQKRMLVRTLALGYKNGTKKSDEGSKMVVVPVEDKENIGSEVFDWERDLPARKRRKVTPMRLLR